MPSKEEAIAFVTRALSCSKANNFHVYSKITRSKEVICFCAFRGQTAQELIDEC